MGGTTTFSNIYCESIASLGTIGFGRTSNSNHARFSGCSFTIISPEEVGTSPSAAVPSPTNLRGTCPGSIPYHFYNGDGIVEFNVCSFNSTEDVLKFGTSDFSKVVLNNCSILTRTTTDTVSISGQNNNITKARIGVSFNDQLVAPSIRFSANNGYGECYCSSVNVFPIEQTGVFSNSSDLTVTINQVPGEYRKGTFQITSVQRPKLYYRQDLKSSTTTFRGSVTESQVIGKGDVVRLSHVADGTTYLCYLPFLTGIPHPQGRNIQWSNSTTLGTLPAGHALAGVSPKPRYVGPIGYISDVSISPASGNYIYTVSGLPIDFPYGQPVRISFSRWDVSGISEVAPLSATGIKLGDGHI